MADLDSESDLIAGFVRAQQPLRDRSAQRAALFRDLTNACEKNVQLGEETATLVTSLQAKRSEFEKKQVCVMMMMIANNMMVEMMNT